MSSPVVLLGPQRFDPTLARLCAELGITGKIATITAGWQERESEDSELNEHLEGRTVNLRLYARAEETWKQDPELRAAHRTRQDRMRHKQDFYRIRLEHELEAAFVIQTRKAPPEILDEERDSSIQAIRDLDDAHLRDCVRERERFLSLCNPSTRPVITKHRDELAALLRGCAAVAIAGGHVATLLNRLELFDMKAAPSLKSPSLLGLQARWRSRTRSSSFTMIRRKVRAQPRCSIAGWASSRGSFRCLSPINVCVFTIASACVSWRIASHRRCPSPSATPHASRGMARPG